MFSASPPDASTHDAAALGQFFTPPAIVDCMLTLVRNQGRVLEPSCGDGAFLRHFPGALGIEIDKRKIEMEEPIKTAGQSFVTLKLMAGVSTRMIVNVNIVTK